MDSNFLIIFIVIIIIISSISISIYFFYNQKNNQNNNINNQNNQNNNNQNNNQNNSTNNNTNNTNNKNYQLPDGGYTRSCNNCTYDGTTLSCSCGKNDGSYNNTSIKPNICSGIGIDNENGNLTCTIPNGGYTRSCNNCTYDGTTLSCLCGKNDGTYNNTSLKSNICSNGIDNQNGNLTCTIPNGGYTRSCNNCIYDGTTLTCSCGKNDGTYNNTSLKPNICSNGIDNENGNLTCTIPNGGYSRSCNNCIYDGSTLTCSCRKNDGSYNNTNIIAKNCINEISNTNGNLQC
jgi:hypothetical protein